MITNKFKDRFEEFSCIDGDDDLFVHYINKEKYLNLLSEIDKVVSEEINKYKNCMDDMDLERLKGESVLRDHIKKIEKEKKELVEALENARDECNNTSFDAYRKIESIIAKHKG